MKTLTLSLTEIVHVTLKYATNSQPIKVFLLVGLESGQLAQIY